jgi:hypothetical protein
VLAQEGWRAGGETGTHLLVSSLPSLKGLHILRLLSTTYVQVFQGYYLVIVRCGQP